MEHCFLQGSKLKCHLDPCEINCDYTYNWEDYKKNKQTVIMLTNPQYVARLNATKNFCNQRTSYCSPMLGWYENGKIQLEGQTTAQIIKKSFQSLLFSIPSTREYIKNFCKLRDEK